MSAAHDYFGFRPYSEGLFYDCLIIWAECPAPKQVSPAAQAIVQAMPPLSGDRTRARAKHPSDRRVHCRKGLRHCHDKQIQQPTQNTIEAPVYS